MASVKKSPDEIKLERYENVKRTLQESRSWLDVKTIVSVSGVSLNFCKSILQELILEGLIGQRIKPSVNSPAGLVLYAKISISKAYEAQQQASSEFREAKSRFLLTPHLRNGTQPKPYVAKENQGASLAMLSRRG